MRRAERREQILAAATRAFARTGFAAGSLDDIATEAGITRVLLYRHFDSKADLYRAVLDRACAKLANEVGTDEYDEGSIAALLAAAAADPDGFRLLFRYAAREPEFRDVVDAFNSRSADVSGRNLTAMVADGPWRRWAAQLLPAVAAEAVIAWLDLGQPDPDQAAQRVGRAVFGVIDAAGRPAAVPDASQPGVEAVERGVQRG